MRLQDGIVVYDEREQNEKVERAEARIFDRAEDLKADVM